MRKEKGVKDGLGGAGGSGKNVILNGLGEGQALTKPFNVTFFPDPHQPYTRISPARKPALHKNQTHTKISTTQESVQQGLRKVGGAAGATVARQVPPASGSSSVRRDDTRTGSECAHR